MSVLRGKRKISKTEFENTFMKLYQYSMTYTSAIPKRRKKWLCTDIDKTMNMVYRDIMEMNDFYTPNACDKRAHISSLSERCVNTLISIEKPLMVMWNVQGTETRKMAAWIELLNKEMLLLSYMRESEGEVPTMAILDWNAVKSANFIRNMSELHRYTHSKVTNANMNYDGTQGALLIGLVNDAFYYVIEANKRIPKTRKQYETRRQNISNAIAKLKALNREMLFYFNLMKYSEKVMTEWSNLLTQEIKMLCALQKSDKKRFDSLQ